jgi:hypothetical protein
LEMGSTRARRLVRMPPAPALVRRTLVYPENFMLHVVDSVARVIPIDLDRRLENLRPEMRVRACVRSL